jgi:hypothetical protein
MVHVFLSSCEHATRSWYSNSSRSISIKLGMCNPTVSMESCYTSIVTVWVYSVKNDTFNLTDLIGWVVGQVRLAVSTLVFEQYSYYGARHFQTRTSQLSILDYLKLIGPDGVRRTPNDRLLLHWAFQPLNSEIVSVFWNHDWPSLGADQQKSVRAKEVRLAVFVVPWARTQTKSPPRRVVALGPVPYVYSLPLRMRAASPTYETRINPASSSNFQCTTYLIKFLGFFWNTINSVQGCMPNLLTFIDSFIDGPIAFVVRGVFDDCCL